MYRRKEVEAITEIPARRVQFYTESGLLSMIEGNPGKGRERLYSTKNIVELLLIGVMRNVGLELSRIKTVMSKIRSLVDLSDMEGDTVPTYLFVQSRHDGSIRVLFSREIFDGKKIEPAQGVFIIDYKRIINRVKSL